MNKNVVAKISRNRYKDVLMIRRCLLHSVNRIQSKNHKIEIHEINQFYMRCFDYKIYILDNKNDVLELIVII